MKQNRIRWIGILTVLLLVTMQVFAQQGVIATTRADLALRTGPGTDWRIQTIMPPGTTVALDGRDGTNNYWVRGINQNGQVGWMASDLLNVDRSQLDTLAIILPDAPITVGAPPAGAVPNTAPANNTGEQPAAQGVQGGLTIQATANLNVRSGPSTNYNRVGALGNGQSFTVDGRDGTIGWVRGITPRGVVGWVALSYTTLSYNQAAELPVVDVNSPFGLAAPGGGQPAASTAPDAPVNIQPVTSTAAVRGFNLGGHVRGLSEPTVNAMRQAGMTWVKKQVRFRPGDDPNGWAGEINNAHALGFRILLGVVGSPQEVLNPGYFDQYAAYVAGLAAVGADAIEIWNEPNLDREWPTGQVNPATYTQLLATSYNAIKGVNPNTLVISGAPAPTGFFGGCSPNGCDDNVYIQGMAAAGAANYMDCVGVHYNEGIVPPSQNANDPRGDSYYTRFYSGMVNTYYRAFGSRKPLCFTELGYLTPEGFGPLPSGFAWAQNVTLAQQAAWLADVRNRARSSGIVRLLIIWNVDFTDYGADPMGGYAMIRPDGSCPACAALGR